MRENGHLHTAVYTANETLSRKVQEMGMDVEQIINKMTDKSKLESDFLGTITSSEITERLLEQMDTLDM